MKKGKMAKKLASTLLKSEVNTLFSKMLEQVRGINSLLSEGQHKGGVLYLSLERDVFYVTHRITPMHDGFTASVQDEHGETYELTVRISKAPIFHATLPDALKNRR